MDRIKMVIESEDDVVATRHRARTLAGHLGFAAGERAMIVAAVTELAGNLLHHVGGGEVLLSLEERDGREGLVVVARDRGPGIGNLREALEGWSGGAQGMGIGLPGSKRVADEFDVDSRVGTGTTVTLKRWIR